MPENHLAAAARPDNPGYDPDTAAGGAVVFADPQSRSLANLLERIAPTTVPVLLTGETGSGKERLARYIHERSGRTGEFVVVQCSPAPQAGRGPFGASDRGTLFFDDVCDLSPALQCELLRLLRENDAAPTAPDGSAASAMRVITSTSTDLGEVMLRGHFRRDLFYRLNIASIKVPPLRQRPGDIVPLANYFLRLYSGSSKPPARALGQNALVALRHYPWPGNVRELENVIRFAALTAPRRELGAEDLRLENEPMAAPRMGRDLAQEVSDSSPDKLARVLAQRLQNPGAHLYDDVEGLLVTEAFRAADGNQVQTATLLGISRNVVRTLLKKHGLLKPARKADQ
jgi:DNA-binding NtrC family response regulator